MENKFKETITKAKKSVRDSQIILLPHKTPL